jgi:hypothetical protein
VSSFCCDQQKFGVVEVAHQTCIMYEAHSIHLRWKYAASYIRASFQSETVEATVKGLFLHAALTLYLIQNFITDFCKNVTQISMRTARSITA